MRKVGILGGMGPEATVLLMQKIIECTKAQDDQDHIPLLVDNNTQVPSRINYLFNGVGKNPEFEILSMAKNLEKAGASALAMSCNTAHFYAKKINNSVNIPFIDMLDKSSSHLLKVLGSASRVGILASPNLQKLRIIDPYFKLLGLEPIFPDNGNELLEVIINIKKGYSGNSINSKLENLCIDLENRKVDCILIACSELSIVYPFIAAFSSLIVLDTLDILANEIVIFSKKN